MVKSGYNVISPNCNAHSYLKGILLRNKNVSIIASDLERNRFPETLS